MLTKSNFGVWGVTISGPMDWSVFCTLTQFAGWMNKTCPNKPTKADLLAVPKSHIPAELQAEFQVIIGTL